MGNCGTREESVVVAAHVQVQQLRASLVKKHTRSFSDISDPSTPRKFEDSRNITIYTNVIAFTLFELETITKSFRSDYVLGEGGFGTVYKGYIDENVRVGLKSLPVAVKVLNKDGLQGHREWLTEVNFLGQLRHPNLVKLVGYCCEDDHRLLVYEFMFRGSLENHLFRSHLTARSDVYSFGVVLLELLTGRKSVDKTRPGKEQSLVDWARPKLTDKRKLLQIIDPRLEGQYSVRAAHKACSLAYYCLSQNPKARPLMSDVVETLEPLQVSSSSGEASTSHGLLPDYRMHRRMTGSVSVGCRATPDPECSPSAAVCRVR